jgi:prepilin-type N-terminal cleavage/methylation domain-containing protein
MSRNTLHSRAFTLIELLIVIAIFVLLLAIAVPAFSSMLYSSEQSLADNHLRIGIAAARDAAVRSPQGTDSAAVFFYDPAVGRTTIVPCVSAGTIKDHDANSVLPPNLAVVDREVFVPVAGFEPVQLPGGWDVRGYAAPGMIDDQWYEKTYPGNGTTGAARQRGNWVFPETGFYDEDAQNNDDGRDRQTFMVRFEGATGVVKSWDRTPVLILAPNPSMVARGTAPWSLFQDSTGRYPFRVDQEEDLARFVRRVVSWPSVGGQSLTVINRQKLLGDISGDTVLAKPVGQLALCSEKRLATAIGARLDSVTNCLYQDVSALPQANREPTFVKINGAAWTDDPYTIRVNSWIEDHLYPTGSNDPGPGGQPNETRTPSDCRIYTLHRYLGTLQEVTGSTWGQGVSQ